MKSESAITELLSDVVEGKPAAQHALISAVVGRLEQIAGREMAALNHGRLDGLTLEPRMLAHDALLKLLDKPIPFENRRHFFRYASQIMARAMLDYQRRRQAQKRGGDLFRVTLSDIPAQPVVQAEALPAAMLELEELDSRKAELVGLKVFWGASMSDIAETLQISIATAERDWRFAKHWLASRLAGTTQSTHHAKS